MCVFIVLKSSFFVQDFEVSSNIFMVIHLLIISGSAILVKSHLRDLIALDIRSNDPNIMETLMPHLTTNAGLPKTLRVTGVAKRVGGEALNETHCLDYFHLVTGLPVANQSENTVCVFSSVRNSNSCAIPPNMGLALCDWLRSRHHHNN